MIVAGIVHEYGGSVEAYLDKLARAVGEADVVVGSDYALALDPRNRPNTAVEGNELIDRISQVAGGMGGMVLPGTMPVLSDSGMSLVAPVFVDGNLRDHFGKESDRGESILAGKVGSTYLRGDCQENNLAYGSGNVAVKICSDRGFQNTPMDTYFEVNMQFDTNAGFQLGLTNDFPDRHILVADSYYPMVAGNVIKDGKLDMWMPVREDSERRVYEL